MSEQGWDLTGLDPDTLAHVEREAAALGLTLEDFLAEILLSESDEKLNPLTSQEIYPQERHAAAAAPTAPLAQKVRGAELSLTATAQELALTLGVISQELAAMSAQLAGAETTVEGLQAGQTALELETARRLDALETALGAAENAICALASAQDTLAGATARELEHLARDAGESLESARAASDAAAGHADRVAEQMMRDLVELRTAMEERLADSANESRARVHAAFKDALDRITALSSRLDDAERRRADDAGALLGELRAAEQEAQSALEETAESLRKVDAELSQAIARANQSNERALREMREGVSAELSLLKEQRQDDELRFQLVDAAVANSIDEIASARTNLEQRLEVAEANAQASVREARTDALERHQSLIERVAELEVALEETGKVLSANTKRVEFSTLAALEHLEQASQQRDAALEARLAAAEASTQALISDIEARLNAGDARTAARLNALETAIDTRPGLDEIDAHLAHVSHSARESVDALQARADAELNAMREGHSQTLTRLGAIERALAQTTGRAESDKRIAAIEGAAARATRALEDRIAALAAQLEEGPGAPELLQRLEDLRARIAPIEHQAGGNADRLQDVARLLGRLSTQQSEAAAQSAERLHRLELTLADLRLDRFGDDDAIPAKLEQRLDAFEQSHTSALDGLRAEIAAFVAENDRRLTALERDELSEDRDLASDFETLRARLEERMHEIEHRGVRALEQVADTVSMIEKRMSPREAATG
jgi:hypothetical protein